MDYYEDDFLLSCTVQSVAPAPDKTGAAEDRKQGSVTQQGFEVSLEEPYTL